MVPLTAFFESNSLAPEDVERTSDREVNSAVTQRFDKFQVLTISAPSCVGDRDCANIGQMCDEFFIDTTLQAFCVCSMDEKLAAVWL